MKPLSLNLHDGQDDALTIVDALRAQAATFRSEGQRAAQDVATLAEHRPWLQHLVLAGLEELHAAADYRDELAAAIEYQAAL